MATVQKSSKINFYKFVQVKEPSSSAAVGSSNAIATKAINTNTVAINNLGATVNSIAKILTDIKKTSLTQLEIDKKDAKKFTAQFTKPQKQKGKGLIAALEGGRVLGFLENLLNLFGGLFKLAILRPALKWIADPKNRKSVESVINILKTVVGFIFKAAEFGIVNTIDGLYNLLSDDTSWWEKLLGLGQAIAGVGTILLGVRYLSNPTKIIKDIYTGVRALIRFVTGGRGGGMGGGRRRGGRLGGALRLAAGAGLAYGSYKAIESLSEDKPEEKARGGKVKKASQGGWISGPQSGYKVSLDGGRSTSFIGHGTEYVARKSNGGAFVVPFNTPGTKTNPHLTQRRMGEAKSQGYKLPGFSTGGAFLEGIKNRDATTGDNANKKIYLHWSAGALNNTALNGDLGYQAYVKTNGIHMHNKYGKTPPYHTYNKNGSNAAGIGIAAGSGIVRERQGAWDSPNAPRSSQYKRMAKEAAGLATSWGWKPSDITNKRVRTHSEEYQDNKAAYGDHFRWDLEKLYGQDALGSGPNKMRNMIKQEMSKFGQKNLNGTDNHDDSQMPSGFMRGLTGVADYITGNRFNLDKRPTATSSSPGGGEQRTGENGDQQPTSDNAHGYGSLLDMIGKRESDSSGGYDAVNQIGRAGGHSTDGYAGPFSKMKQHGGKKLTSMTVGEVMALQAPRSMSDAEWIKQGRLHATGRYQIIGPTLKALVDRGVVSKDDKYNAATQNKLGVALINGRGRNAHGLKNEWVGLQKETDGAILAAYDANGAKTKGGHSAASARNNSDVTTGYGDNNSSTDKRTNVPNASAKKGLFADFLGPRGDIRSGEEVFGRDIYSDSTFSPDTRERQQRQPASDLMSSASGDQKDAILKDMVKITKERNRAREVISNRTQQVMTEVTSSISQSNVSNATAIQMAQNAITQLMSQSNSGPTTPQFIPTGSGGSTGGGGGISGAGVGRAIGGDTGAAIGGITAAALNSFNNPLKGIFR